MVASWSPHTCLVAPSLLAGDHGALRDSALEAQAIPGVSWLHLDLMDGHFVPNLTFGPQTVAALRPACHLYFDVHLMLSRPDRYLQAFAEAGADGITIHTEPAATEPDYDLARTLTTIRNLGCAVGLAINPDTPIEALDPFLGQLDLALLMTVQPGFGGQSFRTDVLPKIAALHARRLSHGLTFRLEVDGGVDARTGLLCREAGADTLVAGSAFYRAPDRARFVRDLTA